MGRIIVMPKMGLTMTEGKIFEWFKEEGDVVKKGEKLFVVETDKLTNDIEAMVDGVLRKIIHHDGVVDVLKPVGIIADENEDISELVKQAAKQPSLAEKPSLTKSEKVNEKPTTKSKRIKASPKAKKLAKELGVNLEDVTATGKGNSICEQDIRDHEAKGMVKASPTAVNIATSLGIDINQIKKSDRVMKKDVIDYWNDDRLQEMAGPEDQRQEMSIMRKVIAERMLNSQNTSATVNYNLSVDTREMQRLRSKLKPIFKATYTDLIVKILARVLLEFPLLNATIDGNEVITRNYVNMGVAVALDDGLIVPVVKFANSRGMESISKEIKRLAGKARTNALEQNDMTGGTFTVTNLGMFNMESFTPIINQPEVAILGINTIKEVACKINGELEFIPMMNLSLTADHRIVDGAVAARFMNRVKEYMENPSILIL